MLMRIVWDYRLSYPSIRLTSRLRGETLKLTKRLEFSFIANSWIILQRTHGKNLMSHSPVRSRWVLTPIGKSDRWFFMTMTNTFWGPGSFPWAWDGTGVNSMPAGGLMRYHNFTLALTDRTILPLLWNFDSKIKILLCPIVNSDIMRQQLLASLQLVLKSENRLLHLLYRLLVYRLSWCHLCYCL